MKYKCGDQAQIVFALYPIISIFVILKRKSLVILVCIHYYLNLAIFSESQKGKERKSLTSLLYW